jgi:hypothetical protein
MASSEALTMDLTARLLTASYMHIAGLNCESVFRNAFFLFVLSHALLIAVGHIGADETVLCFGLVH